MAGLEANVDMYRQPEPKSAQEYASGYNQIDLQNQALQRGNVGIAKDKLELVNKQFELMNHELSTLASDPTIDKAKAAERLNTFAKTYNFPPEVSQHMIGELNQAPDVKSFAINSIKRGLDTVQQLNLAAGKSDAVDTGDQIQPGITASPLMGGGFKPAGPPINKQLPIGQPTVDNRKGSPTFGQPGVVGPRGDAFAPPPPTPTPSLRSAVQPPPPAQQSGFVATGTPPLFEEGKKAKAADQEAATQKLTAIKPALLALDMMSGLRSGPGTETWNKAVAALKANGIISTEKTNDPTAIYQEVNKYMNDYLSRRGGSTDAARDQLMKSSPDLGTQINPALIKLTQTAIAQDRIEAARPSMFKGNDFQNYGKHRADFPAAMDERAFIVDKMSPEERQNLGKELLKLKSSKSEADRDKYNRFSNSLRAFEDSKVSGQ
jgi:hypothetical protein